LTEESKPKGFIEKIEEWDTKVFLSLYNSKLSGKSRTFAKIYSFFGNWYFWAGLWISMGFYAYFFTKNYDLFILFTGGFDQGFVLYLLIRYKIVNRNRPFIKLKEHGVEQHDDLIAENKSFPSGHVLFFLYFGTIFAFYFNNWYIYLIFFLLSIVMAFTRLVLGVHFPMDVIFGVVFALIFAWLYLGFTWVYWDAFYRWLGDAFSFLNPQNWFS
jgi:undecaprenyl-diphosphatase